MRVSVYFQRIEEMLTIDYTGPEQFEFVDRRFPPLDVVCQDDVPHKVQLRSPAGLLVLLAALILLLVLVLEALAQDRSDVAKGLLGERTAAPGLDLEIGELARGDKPDGHALGGLAQVRLGHLLERRLGVLLLHLLDGLDNDPSALRAEPHLPAGELQQQVKHRVPPRDVAEEDAGSDKGFDPKQLAKEVVPLLLAWDVSNGLGLFRQDLEDLVEGESLVPGLGERLFAIQLPEDLCEHQAEPKARGIPAARESAEQATVQVPLQDGLGDSLAVQEARDDAVGSLDPVVPVLAPQELVESGFSLALVAQWRLDKGRFIKGRLRRLGGFRGRVGVVLVALLGVLSGVGAFLGRALSFGAHFFQVFMGVWTLRYGIACRSFTDLIATGDTFSKKITGTLGSAGLHRLKVSPQPHVPVMNHMWGCFLEIFNFMNWMESN